MLDVMRLLFGNCRGLFDGGGMRLQTETPQHQAIDAVRGVAVLLVMLAHADAWQFIYPTWLNTMKGTLGHLGVAVFFVLSGMLIWRSAKQQLCKPQWLQRYWIARLTRILPLYLFVLGFVSLTAPWFIGFFTPQPSWTAFWRHVLFSQDIAPKVSRAFNPVTWTLTYEMMFYVLVPFLVKCKHFNMVMALATALIAQVMFAVFPESVSPFFKYWILFVAGILMAEYPLLMTRLHLVKCVWILLLLVITLPQFGWVFALAIIIVASFNAPLVVAHMPVPVRLLAGLGIISYSVYLWHYLIPELVGPYYVMRFHCLEAYPVFRGVCLTAFVLLCSYFSYRWIERPAMTTLRTVFTNRWVKAIAS